MNECKCVPRKNLWSGLSLRKGTYFTQNSPELKNFRTLYSMRWPVRSRVRFGHVDKILTCVNVTAGILIQNISWTSQGGVFHEQSQTKCWWQLQTKIMTFCQFQCVLRVTNLKIDCYRVCYLRCTCIYTCTNKMFELLFKTLPYMWNFLYCFQFEMRKNRKIKNLFNFVHMYAINV